MLDTLRRLVRTQVEGRNPAPRAVCLDTQSVKTTRVGGPERGTDGGKNIAGRKQHVLVDTCGLLVGGVVHAANVYDGNGAKRLLAEVRRRGITLCKIWADQTYRGDLATWLHEEGYPTVLEIVKRPDGQKGFQVLPRRWVVERSLAWLTFNRELVRDYTYDPHAAEGWVSLAAIRVMLRRLTGALDDPLACGSNERHALRNSTHFCLIFSKTIGPPHNTRIIQKIILTQFGIWGPKIHSSSACSPLKIDSMSMPPVLSGCCAAMGGYINR